MLLLAPESVALASNIPVLGLEIVCPRKGCPWPRISFCVLGLEPSVLDSTSDIFIEKIIAVYSYSDAKWIFMLSLYFLRGSSVFKAKFTQTSLYLRHFHVVVVASNWGCYACNKVRFLEVVIAFSNVG